MNLKKINFRNFEIISSLEEWKEVPSRIVTKVALVLASHQPEHFMASTARAEPIDNRRKNLIKN